jgi:hypothetical protein
MQHCVCFALQRLKEVSGVRTKESGLLTHHQSVLGRFKQWKAEVLYGHSGPITYADVTRYENETESFIVDQLLLSRCNVKPNLG